MLPHPIRTVLLSLLLLAGLARPAAVPAADVEVTLGAPSEALVPGDLLQLELKASSAGYIRWTLRAPRHPHLRLLAAQEFPVVLAADPAYHARWTLTYQAVEPGSGVLGGGFLQRSAGSEELRQELPERSVSVERFADIPDHGGLEPLETESAAAESRSKGLGWLAAVLFAALAGVLLWWRSRSRAGASAEPPPSVRARLRQVLAEIVAEGALPRPLAQSLVNEYGELLAAQTRAALESVAYSKDGDPEKALVALRGELAS